MANLTINLVDNAKGDLGTFVSEHNIIYGFSFDFNNDGNPDLITQDDKGKYAIFFSKNTGWQYPLDSSNLNGTNGFTINTSSIPTFYTSYDTNGNEITDNIILEDEGKRIYVLSSKSGEWQSPIDFSNIASLDNSLVIIPESGKSVKFQTIENFDNSSSNYFDDFLLRTDDYERYYVIFGDSLIGQSKINLSNLNGNNGFVIKGTQGRHLESAYVDFNNDQIIDFISSDGNKSYVVFGQKSGGEAEIDLSNLNGNNGFVINGSFYFATYSTDFNSDGKNDLILSDPNVGNKHYVVFNQDQWNREINLANLDGKNGFVINSQEEYLDFRDLSDFNSDGKQDLLFSGPEGYTVLFSKSKGWSSSIDLANLNREDGLIIVNSSLTEYASFYPNLGINVDINNDGQKDFFFTSDNPTGVGNKTYVLFGPLPGRSNLIDLANLNGSNGFTINNNLTNSYIFLEDNNIVQDVNDDNIDDLILVTPPIKYHVITGKSSEWESSINISEFQNSDDLLFIGKQENSDLLGDESYSIGKNDNFSFYRIFTDKGKLYTVIFDPEEGLQFPVDLSNLNGENGFVININSNQRPILNSYYNNWIDFNNDNNQDISFRANGKQFIIFSQLSGWDATINVSDLDGKNGFVITNGEQSVPLHGLSTMSDLNHDGNQDLIFYGTNSDGSFIEGPSKNYIVLSKETGWDAEIDLSQLDGQNGFVMKTEEGVSIISTDQDINGDQINDILLSNSQKAYIVFGKNNAWDTEIDLSNLGENGFVIDLKNSPDADYEISVQKINNDNIADLLITYSDWYDTTDIESGTYILFGGPNITKNGTLSTSTNYTLQPTEENLTLTGTENIKAVGNSLPNEIQGNSGDNLIQGMAGDDQLNGGNGNDHVQGGDGDDTLTDILKGITNIPNTRTTENTVENNDRVSGGDGEDLLKAGYANDSLYGQDGDDTLHGQLDHDKLFGGASNDVLLGGQGRDQINGNAGDDILTGGASKDKFVFNTNESFTKESLGIDQITDFQLDMDKIVLDRKTFTELSTTSNNILKVDEFAQVTDINQAETSQAIIVYNSTNGALYYNPNGSATGFDTGGQFATLSNMPDLQNSDILIRG